VSFENLFFLLIFLALPLFEWIGRLLRTREAERQRRIESRLPGDTPPTLPPQRRQQPVEATRRDPPVTVRPAPRPVQTRAQTPSPPRPAAAVSRRLVAARPQVSAPPPAVVTTRSSSRRRLNQLGIGGRSALRRAVVARTILGPCVALRGESTGRLGG
jgi:hypothetical protein